jgi:hypothetical protein
VTGITRQVPEYRCIRFLPSVAKRERAPMLNALTYFQRHNRLGSHLRFAVVTAGARVPFGGPLGTPLSGFSGASPNGRMRQTAGSDGRGVPGNRVHHR